MAICFFTAPTSAVFFSSRLWYSNLPVHNRFGFQNVFIMTIPWGCLLLWCPAWPSTISPLWYVNLWENCRFVKKCQVSFKIKVCVKAVIHTVAKTLVISVLHLTILHPILFRCHLVCTPTARWPWWDSKYIFVHYTTSSSSVIYLPSNWAALHYTYRSYVFDGIL